MLSAANNPDVAFFFLAPYYLRGNLSKGVWEASSLQDFRNSLSVPYKSAHIRALLGGYLSGWIYIFPDLFIDKERVVGLPWFVPPFAFLYVFTFMSSVLLLSFHIKIPRCKHALLYSPIISFIFLFGIYVTSISFQSFPHIKFFFLLLILLFFIFGVGWLDLLFFFASPYLFLRAKIRRDVKEEELQWVYDFPPTLSIESMTLMTLMQLGIIFSSWFVVDYFILFR